MVRGGRAEDIEGGHLNSLPKNTPSKLTSVQKYMTVHTKILQLQQLFALELPLLLAKEKSGLSVAFDSDFLLHFIF